MVNRRLVDFPRLIILLYITVRNNNITFVSTLKDYSEDGMISNLTSEQKLCQTSLL
jgi:hypothetical protein